MARAPLLAVLVCACATRAAAPPGPAPRYPVLVDPGADPPAPAPLGTLAILGLEPDDPASEGRAHAATVALRAAATAPFALDAAASDHELAAEKQTASCANEAAACMAAIGADLRVDYLIYGALRGDQLTLSLLDVRAHVNRRVASAPAADPGAAYHRLVDGLRPLPR